MESSDRRYTDQEVALVLQRAAEIEERRAESTAAARGLSLRELHEIARDVGLSPAVIDEAVMAIEAGARPRGASLLGAPLSGKAVRGVPTRLDDDAVRRLVGIVEEQVDVTGTVTEALGTVRWTSIPSGHKFAGTVQVSVSSGGQETQIQVVQRYPRGLRAILHFLPGAWGGLLGAGLAASGALAPLAVVGVGAAAAALGVGIGRAVWQTLARRRDRLVHTIATELVAAAGPEERA
ncbi:MAG: hypothetical protein OER21_12295 [Gemmatimonadota bacterium]|nr:hypothetical protein [Gemmatimonadota bacterium]